MKCSLLLPLLFGACHYFVITVAVLAQVFTSTVELSCYECMHYEGNTANISYLPVHSSCKYGKEPNNEFSLPCDIIDFEGEKVEPTCMTFYTTHDYPVEIKPPVMARACLHLKPGGELIIPPNSCRNMTVSDILTWTAPNNLNWGRSAQRLFYELWWFDEYNPVVGEICSCTINNCN